MGITSRVELTVFDGRRDEFVRVAKALAAATDDEPGTLRYDWFEAADPAEFVVLEEYVDSTAAFAHNAHCGDLLRELGELADMTVIQLHGEITPDLQAFADNMPIVRMFRPLD